MNKALPILNRQYEKYLNDLEKKNRTRLFQKRRKIEILKQEMDLVRSQDWEAIKTKKKGQLELIEQHFKDFKKKGLIKEWKNNRRLPESVDPVVAKHFKRRRCITSDLETIKKKQFQFYESDLQRRINKCEQACGLLEEEEQLIEFQLDTYPVLQQLEQTAKSTPEIKPWCLEHSNEQLLALPSTKPPYHVLDESRIYLTEQVKCSSTNEEASKPPTKQTFLFGPPAKKTAAPAVPSTPRDYVRLLHSKLPTSDNNFCPECRQIVEWEKDERNGVTVCQRCGFTRNVAASCKSSYYGMEIDYTEPFHYEKRNHFIDCLRQRQAKEECNIPGSIFNQVRAEIKRRQIYDPNALRPKHIRKILKALGLNNYYDHEIMIWWVVTGNKPPQFTTMQEKTLIKMFDESMEPYMKYKGERNNYLTYSFAIHKMLEVLDWPRQIREFYPVLKSDSKRQVQEQIFHKVCTELGWPIIQTEQQFIDEAKY